MSGSFVGRYTQHHSRILSLCTRMNYSEIWVLYAAALLAVAFAWFLVNKTYFRRSTQNKVNITISPHGHAFLPHFDTVGLPMFRY